MSSEKPKASATLEKREWYYFSQTDAMIASGVWILVCVAFFVFYPTEEVSVGDIGALLSGFFAPLAWLWFYVSFQVQSKELALQRQELSFQRESLDNQTAELNLQRLAFENQVKAQEGSEQALKSQLVLTERQFQQYIKVLESKKPLFRISRLTGHELNCKHYFFNEYGIDPQRPSIISGNDYKSMQGASLRFTITNIAGDAIIKEVETKLDENYESMFKVLIEGHSRSRKYDLHIISIPKGTLSVESQNYEETYREMLNHLSLIVFYSYSEGSNTDIYKLIDDSGSGLAIAKES